MTMSDPRSYTGSGPRPGDFVNALEHAVRENPISAALIGMGVLWLFMGGSNTSLFGGGGRKSIFTAAARGAEQVGGTVGDTAGRMGNATAEAASQVVGAIRQASAAVGDATSRSGAQAVDAISGAYSTTADLASGAVERISDVTSRAATSLQTGANWGGTLKQNLSDVFERQPMLLGAVGLAIGAGIAASLPATEAEKKAMAGASNFVRDTLTERAAEVKQMVDAGVQEFKTQGLRLQGAGETLHSNGNDRKSTR